MKKLLVAITLLHPLSAHSVNLQKVHNFYKKVLTGPLEEAKYEIESNLNFINSARDHSGDMLLHVAVSTRKYRRIKALLELGASTEVRNEDMETPLHVAVKEGNLKAVALLLQYNANVHVWEHYEYRTPLHYAVEFNRMGCATMLLDAGASPDAPGFFENKSDYHYSARMLAVDADLAVDAHEGEPQNPMTQLLENYQGASLNWKEALHAAFPAGVEALAQD